jgi:dipeptidase E
MPVRLYLSSFRIGDHPEYLMALVGDGSRRTVVIANAMDDAPEEIRHAGVERELAALGELGFDAAELDLRDYFDDEQRLRRELAGVALA